MNYFSKYKFDKSKFKLGMRTFKTGLAVFIILLMFSLFGWDGLQIGALTAVFSLREDFDKSVHFGTSRILGNSIGGFYALIFFLINKIFQDQLWVTLLFVPICTMLTIMTNVAMNNKAGIIGGVSAMLIITLSIPNGETFLYVFARIFETFIGVFVAILVNSDVDRIRDFIKERKVNEQNKKKHISLESLSQELEEQQLKELKCIIRADSKGSVEALKESLLKLNNEKAMINIIQGSAGAVTEGDVKLAEASNAIIIAFNVRPTTPARIEAEKTGVEIRNYNVIYHVTEEIEKALKGMLDPEYKEVYFGRIEVKQVFKVSNVGNVAGAAVVDGKVTKDSKIRVIRDGIIIFDGELGSLKRFKDDVKEVVMGQECGIGIQDFNDIKAGDIIESYIMEEIPR